MIKNWREPILNLYGKQFKRPVTDNGVIQYEDAEPDPRKPLTPMMEGVTLGMVVIEALTGTLPGDDKEKFKDKMLRTRTAERIIEAMDANEPMDVPLEAKQVAEIQERVSASGWHTVVVTRVCRLLDAETDKTLLN